MTALFRLAVLLGSCFGIAAAAGQMADARTDPEGRLSVRFLSLAEAPGSELPDLVLIDQASEPPIELTAVQDLANARQILVGAVLAEQAGPQFVLIAPDGEAILRKSLPVRSPLSGPAAFVRREHFEPLTIAEVRGLRLGLVSPPEDVQVLERMAASGADLVLIVGGPTSAEQVMRYSVRARVLGIGLLISADCRRASQCISAAAVSQAGAVTFGKNASLSVTRDSSETTRSAFGLPQRVPQPRGIANAGALADLGRQLFFSRALSGNGSVSCASCHQPAFGFGDRRARSIGSNGQPTRRNTPGLLNAAFRSNLRWDGYPVTLEQFIKYPVSGRDEMDAHDLSAAARQVAHVPGIGGRFRAAFGSEQIDFPRIEKALGAYLRSLVSGDSPFDRAVAGGQPEAMNAAAWRGYGLFNGRAGCAACHSWSSRDPFFTDQRLHNTGWGWDANQQAYLDAGAGALGQESLTGQFRTPSLRDLARTGPYMHDGGLRTLREVIDFFDRGGLPGPGRDPLLRPLHLSAADKVDLEQFLIALTGTTTYDSAGRRTERDQAE